MKNNFSRYLIFVLIALFFASINELSAKEAEQNYNAESHSFIESVNFSLSIPIDKQKDNCKKHFPGYPFVISPDFYYNNYFDSLYANQLKFLPQFFHNNLYIDISILRI